MSSSCLNSDDFILLVDGEFGLAQAIRLQEIRNFTEAGHVLVGCTSLGALRAVEAQTIGVRGVGSVYYEYLIGYRSTDSDVAVPALEDGTELGPSIVDLDQFPKAVWESFGIRITYPILKWMRQTHYAERTYPLVADMLQVGGLSPGQTDFLIKSPGRNLWSLKRDDSFRVINTILIEMTYRKDLIG